MKRYDRFFRGFGIVVIYMVMTVSSIELIKHNFGTPVEGLLNYVFLIIGALGMWIFWKWITE